MYSSKVALYNRVKDHLTRRVKNRGADIPRGLVKRICTIQADYFGERVSRDLVGVHANTRERMAVEGHFAVAALMRERFKLLQAVLPQVVTNEVINNLDREMQYIREHVRTNVWSTVLLLVFEPALML